MTGSITGCLTYLNVHLSMKDGFSNVRMALLAGILPAILRCNRWISQDSEDYRRITKILDLISLYIIYPSVLRPFLVSARRIDDLGLVDDTQPISAVYQKLVNLVAERRAMIRPKDDENVDLSVRCTNCGKPDIGGDFKACSGCFFVSYCSEGCQKEGWTAHEGDCRMVQNLREEGEPIPMLPDDLEYLNQFAMEQVNQHRAEIARVWREEQPTRTPLVSFDFSQNPNGVMVVGKRCMETVPGSMSEGGIYVPEIRDMLDGRFYFRLRWEDTTSRPVHDEDAIICMFVPQGEVARGRWMYFGINPDFYDDEGTVTERLIKTVEHGIEYGYAGPTLY
ncbi:hypothetical protein C8R44DRAFT_23780 [Mycena epipterygia]|nr:hypothetical protein C8R44DRAFT_23780 [Mycena epipterygia]